MMNTIKIGVITFVCWCASSTALAERVMFETLGKFAQIQLPKNMCDYTDTEYGRFVRSFLTERANSSELASQMPEIKIIFAKCDLSDEGYPWGWIGSFPQDATGFTQGRLNDYLEKNLNGIIARVDDKLDSQKALREFEQSTGFKLGDSKVGVPLILATNSDLFLHSVAQESSLDGEPLNEVIITASMIRNGRAIYIYAYELQSKAPSVLELAQSLKRSASSLTVR